MAEQNPTDVTGYPKSVEHERGANSSPLGSAPGSPKAATYAKPKRHPAPVDPGADSTGAFGGNKAMKVRSAKVQP